jgi:putative tricarboxylic transport membrane protein
MVAAAVAGAWGLSGTLSVPSRILVPILMLCAMIGAYASRNASFDVYLMLFCGALGYLMKRTGYSPAATVMGLILAPIADSEFIRIIQLYGQDWFSAFVSRPMALGIVALILGTFIWSAISKISAAKKSRFLADDA